MIGASDRIAAVELIGIAKESGARIEKACDELGISVRTYQRWIEDGSVSEDLRPAAVRPAPRNKLSRQEREYDIFMIFVHRIFTLKPRNVLALKRLGKPQDIAILTSFLISDKADWITGQIIGVDGGRSVIQV